MPSKPGLFVYSADWRSEPTFALVSEGARLLWWEMLLLMAEGQPRGHLLINGHKPTSQQIATLTRTDPAQVESRLAELETHGVFSRLKNGVIISRRIVRDEEKARKNRENGEKGGNPSLRKQREKTQSDKPPDKARARIPSTSLEDISSLRSDISGADAPHRETRRRPKSAAPFPDDFTLTAERRAYAEQRHPGINAQATFEQFRNHHLAKGSVFKDWDAAWRTWLASPYPKIMLVTLNGQRAGPPSKLAEAERIYRERYANLVLDDDESDREPEDQGHRGLLAFAPVGRA